LADGPTDCPLKSWYSVRCPEEDYATVGITRKHVFLNA